MKQNTKGNDLIRLCVVLGDFVILNLLLLATFQLIPVIVPQYFHAYTRITVLVANLSMLTAQLVFKNSVLYRKDEFEQVAKRIFKLTFFHCVLMFVFLRLLNDGGGFFRFMFIFGFLEFIFILFARVITREILKRMRQSGLNSRDVVLIGDDPATLMVYNEMLEDSSIGYNILGYFANNELANCPASLQRLGTLNDLNERMNQHDNALSDLDEIFCSMSHSQSDEIIRIMRFCDEHIIHFYYVPRMFGNFRLNLKPEKFGDIALFTNYQEPLSKASNRVLKRAFDIVFSSIVCICLLPFIPIIAFLIKRQSPGPLIFAQDRTGFNGKTFRCYKFRSMHVNKDADTLQATEHDPRKFGFGDFMRRTNIDELPQFFNVLKGDMSVVGPRPHMLKHTEIYSKIIGKYMVRHFCKPGITGYAQVTGFRGETKEVTQMEGRIDRDIWYIENWSFWLDIKIILLTIVSLFKHDKNAY